MEILWKKYKTWIRRIIWIESIKFLSKWNNDNNFCSSGRTSDYFLGISGEWWSEPMEQKVFLEEEAYSLDGEWIMI